MTPADLNNLRFAFSPLWELAASYWTLMNPSLYAVHLPWVNEAAEALAGRELPYLSALITDTGHFADFMAPTPQTPRPSFEGELARLRDTTPEILQRDIGLLPESRVTEQFRQQPSAAMESLIDELRFYWEATLAQHWPRMNAVLEGDVIYHARQLAFEGADSLFNDLHHTISWADDCVVFDTHHAGEFYPAGRGLTLIPLVFMWKDIMLPEHDDPDGLTVAYSARGAGLWSQEVESPDAMLIAAFGEGRARVLALLETPRSTGDLAERLDVTPGNVSLHIARLREAGLVESQHTGKWVFHRLTQRGEQLLALFV